MPIINNWLIITIYVICVIYTSTCDDMTCVSCSNSLHSIPYAHICLCIMQFTSNVENISFRVLTSPLFLRQKIDFEICIYLDNCFCGGMRRGGRWHRIQFSHIHREKFVKSAVCKKQKWLSTYFNIWISCIMIKMVGYWLYDYLHVRFYCLCPGIVLVS